MHHGYYPSPNFRDHQAAQRLMIEKSLEFAYNGPFIDFSGKRMVDVGCGVGGSSRYIVRKYGGSAEGLSLSPFQVQKANSFSEKIGLSRSLHYQVADAMNMPFLNDSFDLSKLTLWILKLVAKLIVQLLGILLFNCKLGVWNQVNTCLINGSL